MDGLYLGGPLQKQTADSLVGARFRTALFHQGEQLFVCIQNLQYVARELFVFVFSQTVNENEDQIFEGEDFLNERYLHVTFFQRL